MRIISILAALVMVGMLFFASVVFPVVGDPASPSSVHVNPRYIEEGYYEHGSPNLVVGVLADYRSFDTFGEVIVIYTAGAAGLIILKAAAKRKEGLGGDN